MGELRLLRARAMVLGEPTHYCWRLEAARLSSTIWGGGATGGGKSSEAADKVVAEINAAGGRAVANYDSVEDGSKIIQCALDSFGKIDIVINNAGILRDTTFAKMSDEDWQLIQRVHMLGAFRVTQAAWGHMRDTGFGRIIFTASAAGIYGNFGQANYAAAKMGVIGFSNTLALEGKKRNIHVNTIAPIAGSRLTETVLPKELIDALKAEYVSPLVAYLCHESCTETGSLFEVGGGFFGKLRFERTEGKLFKLGRTISPEQLQKHWPVITDFSQSTHPTDITSSMQPILGNLQSQSLGGNDLIDVDLALGYEFQEQKTSYDERDLSLYALGVGAGADPLDDSDLRFIYEMHGTGFQALPTFAVTPAIKLVVEMAKRGEQAPGLNYGLERILHGEQYLELKAPLPTKATLTHKAKIKNIYDKGKNALVVTEIRSFDENGTEIIYNEFTSVVRGAGGWGGDRGPSSEINTPPDRAPDATITQKISDNQALLYRLSGDINPLHIDPMFAQMFGFDKPILHGLCTFGYATRHVLKTFASNDGRLFKSIKVRFSDSVFPGETLVTEIWKISDTQFVFRAKVQERNKIVLSNAAIELYKEIPKLSNKAKTTVQPESPKQESPEEKGPNSADVFVAIRSYIDKHPELINQIGKIYLFKLTNPSSQWTLDLKSATGTVSEGSVGAIDCTLELTEANFMAMTSGKADPQKLYFDKQLKISGDLMASQKLTFLKKLNPEEVKAAIGKAQTETKAQPTPTPSRQPAAPKVLRALKDRVSQSPSLANELQGSVQFVVKNPDASFLLDCAGGSCQITEGILPAQATLTLEDETLEELAKTGDIRSAYQHGRLRVDGSVHLVQKLIFLKGIL